MSKPRVLDMKMAAHMVDYFVCTVDAPLVLGGPILEPEIYADASFASLPERRSIMGHLAVTGRICPDWIDQDCSQQYLGGRANGWM